MHSHPTSDSKPESKPKRKIRTLTLECCANGYEVIRITDSVAFCCGDILSRTEVGNLCESLDWSVRIFRKGEALLALSKSNS